MDRLSNQRRGRDDLHPEDPQRNHDFTMEKAFKKSATPSVIISHYVACDLCDDRLHTTKYFNFFAQAQAGAWYCGWCFVRMKTLTSQAWVGYNHD